MKGKGGKFLVNEKITFPKLRVVSDEGEQKGILPLNEAKKVAKNAGLDLVVISEKADPPVARIIDYSKFKYDQDKKQKELQKKNRANKLETKEINIRPNTDVGDITRLESRASQWLNQGNNVKINMILKGRERSHKDDAKEVLTNFVDAVKNNGPVKSVGPIQEAGRGMNVTLTA